MAEQLDGFFSQVFHSAETSDVLVDAVFCNHVVEDIMVHMSSMQSWSGSDADLDMGGIAPVRRGAPAAARLLPINALLFRPTQRLRRPCGSQLALGHRAG